MNRPAKTVRQTYPFEIYASNRPPSEEIGDGYLETLKANLGIGDTGPGADGVLKRLVQVLHVNAQWFKDKAEEEEWWVKVYVLASVGLGVLIPVVVVALSGAFTSTGSVVVAQLSAIITGVMGLHRTLGKWLGQRAAAGTYWNARSQLVDAIYTLESDWGTVDETDKLAPGTKEFTDRFHEAILAAIATGREIVRAHMDAYYAGLKPETTDDIEGRVTGLTANYKEIRRALDELKTAA